MNGMKRQKYMTLEDEPARLVGVQYVARGEWRNSSIRNEEAGLKQKYCSVVYGSRADSKVQIGKEQYCIKTWSVKSVNQGKLEVVKQEMARMNIDILGISKLEWTGMGEFNSDDHYIYY